jgi:hypothetical protein
MLRLLNVSRLHYAGRRELGNDSKYAVSVRWDTLAATPLLTGEGEFTFTVNG